VVLVGLDGQGEQQGGNGCPDHDVGQGEGADDRVDGFGADGDVEEDRSGPATLEADRQQQDVGGGLDDREAGDGVDQVAAGDDPVQPDRNSQAATRYGRNFM
jgi:hypothetical protein